MRYVTDHLLKNITVHQLSYVSRKIKLWMSVFLIMTKILSKATWLIKIFDGNYCTTRNTKVTFLSLDNSMVLKCRSEYDYLLPRTFPTALIWLPTCLPHDSDTCLPWLPKLSTMAPPLVYHGSPTCLPWLPHLSTNANQLVYHGSPTCLP